MLSLVFPVRPVVVPRRGDLWSPGGRGKHIARCSGESVIVGAARATAGRPYGVTGVRRVIRGCALGCKKDKKDKKGVWPRFGKPEI
jgi:hypothetical protein